MSGPRPSPRARWGRAAAGPPLAALLLVAGCTGDAEEPAPARSAAASATPLADVDAGGLTLARAPFCDAVADAAVEAALGGPAESARAWGNGDEVAVSGGADVAHEFGCAWRGGSATAAAWVFAPPLTAERARAVVRDEQRRPGCRPLPGAAPFGDPSVALLCRTPGGGAPVASYRGLFGDAWLTCEVRAAGTTDDADLAGRADRWCAAVLGAAAA